jgi:preprotein translocase subunit SecE
MDTQEETAPTLFDTAKLIVALAILVGSVFGYYYYASASVLYRAVGVFVGFIVAVVIAFQSAQGKTLWRFIQGSRVEMRKVVWPTREETFQTTIVVLVFATIMGVFFWLLDLSLLWFTGMVTGRES